MCTLASVFSFSLARSSSNELRHLTYAAWPVRPLANTPTPTRTNRCARLARKYTAVTAPYTVEHRPPLASPSVALRLSVLLYDNQSRTAASVVGADRSVLTPDGNGVVLPGARGPRVRRLAGRSDGLRFPRLQGVHPVREFILCISETFGGVNGRAVRYLTRLSHMAVSGLSSSLRSCSNGDSRVPTRTRSTWTALGA